MARFFFFLFSIGSMIFRGFVVSKLWNWFVVRQFDLKPLSVTMAMGLGLIVTLMTWVYLPSRQEAEERNGEVTSHEWAILFTGVFLSLVFWGEGFIVQHFLG